MLNPSELVEVYLDTKKVCEKHKKSISNVYNSILLRDCYCEHPTKNIACCNIEVVNEDVLVVAEKYKDSVPAVLNLADNWVPGGLVTRGAMAQEEELFRRTDCFLSVEQHMYPLQNTRIIYTQKVKVIKDTQYRLLEPPFNISMISASAISNPILEKNGDLNSYDYDLTLETLKCVFKSAIMHKKDTLVLGAFGCGEYNNPPLQIIEIFNELLHIYRGYFKKIVFAVYSRNDNNFELFDKHIWR
jgi:uncharacterized protein (TIGR02452 family)